MAEIAVIKTPNQSSLRSDGTGQAGGKSMTQFAVIKTGGKQYIVRPGQKIKIEKLPAKEGEEVVFDQVFLLDDGKEARIGTPHVPGAKVIGKLLKQGKAKKVIVFKFKAKKREKTKKGHRQPYSEVEILKIETNESKSFVKQGEG